jgi:hypothetical protein
MLYNGMSDAFFKIWKCDGLLGTETPHTRAHRTRIYLASRVCCGMVRDAQGSIRAYCRIS